MRKDLTEIVVVIDRSGSMSSCRADAVGGLNTLVKEQKEVKGEAKFTLVQFDTEYEIVHNGIDIKDVPELDLVPRGGTALYDAVCKTIVTTGERLAKMAEKDRPGLVLFVVVTDGGENSSKEYKDRSKVKEMIDHQTNVYNWKFTYLGSDVSGFANDSGGYGSAVLYDNNKVFNAIDSTSKKFSRMRGMSMNNEEVSNDYSVDEIQSMTS